MKRLQVVCVLSVALALPAAAQVRIEQRRPAPAGGEVSIDSAFGEVIVRGWDKAEVMVTGELAAGAEGLDFDSDKEEVDLRVENPEEWFYAEGDDSDFRSRLEIFVPAASSLRIETINASIDIEGVTGEAELETVNGAIRARGGLAGVEADTLTGDIEIAAAGCPMSVESISGAVILTGASGEVEVQSVSGSVDVRGRNLEELQIETVAGSVTASASLVRGGDIYIETFSGDVTLTLPKAVRAEFELTTFAGTIESALGPKALPAKRFEPFTRLRFATDLDAESDVEVDTHEGNIVLRVAGGPGAE